MRLTIPIKESFIALLGGILAFGFLTIFAIAPITLLLHYAWLGLFGLLLNVFLEEGFKLLFIKWFKVSSGILFGFSYGIMEVILKSWGDINSFMQSINFAIILHIITAIILVYSIKKKKVFWGFLIVVVLHTLYNFLIVNFL